MTNKCFSLGRTSKLSLLVLAISVLSSCGFKLRGNYLIPPELQTLYVTSNDVHGELTRIVKSHLRNNKINLKSGIQDGVPIVRILKDNLDRRTLSLFENGQVAEYELIYSVFYEVHIPNKEPKSFNFELNRDYQDDPNRALAKNRELALLLSELRLQAADRILRNLASIQP